MDKAKHKINPMSVVTCYNFISFSFLSFVSVSGVGMEKSLVDNKPNDPNAEPCENYENLPFHGLQNPPTKVRQIISLVSSSFSRSLSSSKTHHLYLIPINYLFLLS